MLYFFTIIIIATIIYTINKDYKNDLRQGVEKHGGMLSKYHILIDYFTLHPASKIIKQTNSSIVIGSSTITVYIDYVAGDTEIQIKVEQPIVGKFSKTWKFPNGYPQKKMIEEIENYLEWKMKEYDNIIKKSESNFYSTELFKSNVHSFNTISVYSPKEEYTSYKEILTVEEFCAQQGVSNISVRANHKNINEKTGQPNLFMTWGAGATGAVALKVQQNFHEHQEGPSRPLIGLFEVNGEDVYILFDQSEEPEETFSLNI